MPDQRQVSESVVVQTSQEHNGLRSAGDHLLDDYFTPCSQKRPLLSLSAVACSLPIFQA